MPLFYININNLILIWSKLYKRKFDKAEENELYLRMRYSLLIFEDAIVHLEINKLLKLLNTL